MDKKERSKDKLYRMMERNVKTLLIDVPGSPFGNHRKFHT